MARLAEHAHRCADKAIAYVDDSDGWLTGFSVRLLELHLRACEADPPDPAGLAARLVELELGSELIGFDRCAATYREVLGPEGLTAFREHLEPHLKQVADGNGVEDSFNGFAVRNAKVGWALGTGDPDVLIEVHSTGRPLPEGVLEIAQALDRAGRVEEAIAWARRGLADWGGRPWQVSNLREFLAGKLRDGGNERAAIELFWQAFASGPSLTAYRRLLDEGDEADWLRRCRDHLRSSLARASQPEAGRRATPAVAFGAMPPVVPEDAVALLDILLYEGCVDEAWKAAHDYGARAPMWLTLARTRERDHPLDAMAGLVVVSTHLRAQIGSVGRAAPHYPFMGLVGDGGDTLEVGVIVEHGELPGLGNCRDKGVHQRKRPVLTRLSQKALHFDCPPVVGVCGGSMGKSGQHFHECLMIGRALGTESEFEDHRSAHRNAPLGDQGSSS